MDHTDRYRDPLRDKPVVVLSIDERWADAILTGEKIYEYRRAPPAIDPPYRVVLYATGDIKALVGGFETHRVESGPVESVITKTVSHTPHDPDDLRNYFEGKEEAHAIRVASYIRYDEPVELEDPRAGEEFHPPQNFRYLEPDDHAQILQQLPYDRGVPYER